MGVGPERPPPARGCFLLCAVDDRAQQETATGKQVDLLEPMDESMG